MEKSFVTYKWKLLKKSLKQKDVNECIFNVEVETSQIFPNESKLFLPSERNFEFLKLFS